MPNAQNPLIIQSDNSLLLETNNKLYEEVRDQLVLFAELIKSPEHIHTYRLTPLSLWNAAAAGVTFEYIRKVLDQYTKYAIPENVIYDIADYIQRYGKLKLVKDKKNDAHLLLISDDVYLIREIGHNPVVKNHLTRMADEHTFVVPKANRGLVKQVLIKVGYPVEDLAGYVEGEKLDVALRAQTLKKKKFSLREYQADAIGAFYANGSIYGGNGVIVLPCGAGKTVVAMGVLDKLKTNTLILVTNITAARQWIEELLDKTDLKSEDISEYSGEVKEIKPVTIATYQILVYRKSKQDPFAHFGIFDKRNWGLIVYDEVHLLPAPVFRSVAHLQARRRLGLTATLVREDNKEEDVFSLIGPKKYDVPWKVLEKQGWIAKAICTEMRVPLSEDLKMKYTIATDRHKFKLSSTNPDKKKVIIRLMKKHEQDNVLIIGQYIDQLEELSSSLSLPIVTGKTKNKDRIGLYNRFRSGEISVLIVSKVANFAVDLPEANVALQISGTFGSRQEEAQRLGRILRPKTGENTAFFYSIITKTSVEEDFALKRQLFLTEQGYKYRIVNV